MKNRDKDLFDDKVVQMKPKKKSGKPRRAVVASTSTKYTGFQKCYRTHKPMPLPGGFFIHGGGCSDPVIKDADIYVGLDMISMSAAPHQYPWTPAISFLFKIRDMDVPDDVEEFAALIKYLYEQIQAGKKVHVGCIGGHGRTGMVLAALYKHFSQEKDAITYVRNNYCTKAVESAKQVAWLTKHFGIKKVKGSKALGSGTQTGRFSAQYPSYSNEPAYEDMPRAIPLTKNTQVSPVHHLNSIWGVNSPKEKV